MIISHKYKFIFIKTLKTAGTSIEVDLNNILHRHDVATPIFPAIDGHVARNYEFRKYGLLPRKFSNHIRASEVRRILGNRVFSKYFKFRVEREPVDKCISHYSMFQNSPTHKRGPLSGLSWDEYVEKGDFPTDIDKYTDRFGLLLVDRIVKYENLENELKDIANQLGFEYQMKARAKSGFRMAPIVTEDQKQIIYAAFADSNTHTGYHSS